MTRRTQRFRYQSSARPAALLIALQDAHQSAHSLASSAIELARLARGLGIEVVRTLQQSRSQGTLCALLNETRLRELAAFTTAEQEDCVDMVLVDGQLTPSQQRTLENALQVEVLDRSAVILRVFEQRARTREARLQVELARRMHQAPRLRDDRKLQDRQGGGGGRAARGHNNLVLAKQQNRERMAELRRELKLIPEREAVRRQRRRELPQVALVGYTNAGKSSLMHALTGSEVHVEDAPFATLDLTTRALVPEGKARVLLSDTVGFIAALPHELVASFRATLEEARHADLLLVVLDASDPDLGSQLDVTRRTLAEIGAGDVPQQLVLNKADRLHPAQRDALAFTFPDAWLLSAHDERDVDELRRRLQRRFEASEVEWAFLVPYTQPRLLSEMHARASIVEQRHTDEGTRVHLRATPSAILHWSHALTG